MTLTPWDLALASMAAPEPESRLTSRRIFAPLVMACSACCCCVDLSPSAFWIVTGTPASSNAFSSSGRSAVSQRTEDFVSGSRTATFCGLAAAVAAATAAATRRRRRRSRHRQPAQGAERRRLHRPLSTSS